VVEWGGMKKYAAIILVVVLLLLPMLYVGSYLAVVVPQGYMNREFDTWGHAIEMDRYYRFVGWPETLFWPLEQFDRVIRPRFWGSAVSDPIENQAS